MRTERRTRVAIGLGANLGSPREAFSHALRRLASHLAELRVSPLYRTAPVGGPKQPDYLNAVAVGQTTLGPGDLLSLLLRLEAEAGRKRRGEPANAPRLLDLDLLLYGRRKVALPGLVVPHPRLPQRRFVLAPLADLLPDFVVPGTRKTVSELLSEAPRERVRRLARGVTGTPEGGIG